MNKPSSPTYTAPLFGWVCFHCGKHFARSAVTAARRHFGPTPNATAACGFIGKAELVRELRVCETMLEEAIERLVKKEQQNPDMGPWTGGITPNPETPSPNHPPKT